MQLVSLKDCLTSMKAQLDLSPAFDRYRALEFWSQVCGPQVAAISRPYRIKGDTLFVGVKDPIWATELSHFQLKYIQRFRELLGDDSIRHIRFVPRPGLLMEKKNKKAKGVYDPRSMKLPAGDERKIQAIIGEIRDEKARVLMAGFLREKYKYDRWMKKQGASPCPACGVLVPKGQTLCVFCQIKVEEKNRENLIHLLEENPWLSYSDACNRIPSLAGDMFRAVRKKIINDLYREVVNEMETSTPDTVPDTKRKIVTLAMMMIGMKPSQLSDQVLGEHLSSRMYQFYKAPAGTHRPRG